MCKRSTLITLLAMCSLCLQGQEESVLDTVQARPLQPIPIKEITLKATAINTQLREMRSTALKEQGKARITQRIDSLNLRLALLREDPRIQKTESLNLWSLEILGDEWKFMSNMLEEEQLGLTHRLEDIEKKLHALDSLERLWELTQERLDPAAAAPRVIEQVNTTLKDIRSTHEVFQTDSRFLQEELASITEGIIFTNELVEQINQSRAEVAKSLLTINRPPVWDLFQQQEDTLLITERRSLIDDTGVTMRDFYGQFKLRIWIHLVLSVIIIISVFLLFRQLEHSIPDADDPEIVTVRKITHHPFASGFLICLILSFLLYMDIPEAVFLLISLLLFIPVIIILRTVITGAFRKYIYLPLGAMLLIQIHRLVYAETLFSRIWLLLVIAFGILTILLIVGGRTQRQAIARIRGGRVLLFVAFSALILLSIAFIANIFGAVLLSEYLTQSTIGSINIALFVYALVITLRSIITTIVFSNYLGKSTIMAKHQEIIFTRLKGLVNLAGVLLLINFILRIFRIWNPVWSSLNNILTYEVTVGSMVFTLWNIILFFLIIILTIWTSRMIRIIFEDESTIRSRMRRGIPAALSLILRITIFTVGFLIAVAAAGVQMDKLAILLGAFGVGIGFGLQNIFNNLVSGIILAFERPIKEDDIIEVGTMLGIVKEIGIRSSVIRTYDGSEVIIPNGNLISNDLINWTRSDMRRRCEVLFGVAYGTDPTRVLGLMREVIEKEDEALRDPGPLTLFLGFGESSLDFRLLFWIPDADARLQVQSRVAVKINDALKAAGIEIPFPQRDLHVRSVESRVMDQVRTLDHLQKGQKPENLS